MSEQEQPPDGGAPPEPGRARTPFHRHSLIGDVDKLRAQALQVTPLFGSFLMNGHSSMIYAKPNSGKTLILLSLIISAVEEGRVSGDDILFVNADDNSSGLAEKGEILARVGVHMVAPNLKGFKVRDFADKLREAAVDGSARGRIVVIDTIKKMTNLMDKTRSSEFANVCREFVMAGGTIIGLGHTAKNPNPDGSPRYQGTTDILEDFDAVYVAEVKQGPPGAAERVVVFRKEKSRADSPQEVAYAYSTEEGGTYEDKLWSLRVVETSELEGLQLEALQVNDADLIEVIRYFLKSGQGDVGKDKMLRAVASMADAPRSQVERVLNAYTGSDPARHLWNYTRGDRGKRTYTLLPSPPEPAAGD